MIQNILTVCVGNICRSPMAAALFASALPQTTVSSAGVGALIGSPADPLARELLHDRGIDINTHRARQIDKSICAQSDIIFAMELHHKLFIEENFPSTRGKVFRLGEFQKIDIPDPYRQDKAAFEYALKLIDASVKVWSEKISKM